MAMDQEYSITDVAQLLKSASDFANYPGLLNDASVREFLDRFPLPVIFNALQTRSDQPGLETVLVSCLDRIFQTKCGASLIPHNMQFVEVGLKANSQQVRCLACNTVTYLLENVEDATVSPVQPVIDYNIYPCLLDCLLNGDEQVANASVHAIKTLAETPQGLSVIFPSDSNEATNLGNLAAQSSSLGRVRVISLIVKLFSISSSVASVIYNLKLLSLLEMEVGNTDDTLVVLNALELFYELAEIPHSTEFLSRTKLLQVLRTIISNTLVGGILRSRAMMIIGRLLSKDNVYEFIDESTVRDVISALDVRLETLEAGDADEYESALEALGQIGSTIQGATFLLTISPPAARHVINAAFDRQGRGRQLAALHALGYIAGETRPENTILLDGNTEDTLRRLVYDAASRSTKLSPSGLFLSVLQQAAEIRLGGYRMLAGMAARPWCLIEICSNEEIINILTNSVTETTKIGMEARYSCCSAIHKSFTSSKLISDPARSGIAQKLQETISNGPYLVKKRDAQPIVKTAERF